MKKPKEINKPGGLLRFPVETTTTVEKLGQQQEQRLLKDLLEEQSSGSSCLELCGC